MKRNAPDVEGGGGESGGEGDGAPDAKRARIAEAELRSVRAQLAAKDEEIAAQAEENAAQAAALAAQAATLQALTPLPVLNVSVNFRNNVVGIISIAILRTSPSSSS